MLLEENFQKFDYFDALEYGLYFIIIGYYALLFFYFLLMRFRTSKKPYWFFFSLLFLCLALGRFFFQVYYFFAPELEGEVSDAELVATLMFYYRMATFFSWLGIACLMGVLGILLFPPDMIEEEIEEETKKRFVLTDNMKTILRLVLIVIPIIIGILVLFLPDSLFMDPDIHEKYDSDIDLIVITIGSWSYPAGRFVLNLILLPIFIAIIPLLFLYLGWKTFGVLRKSYILNGIGFLIYYSGRLVQGLFDVFNWPHVRAVAPPLLILLALIRLVIANNYEQLR